VPPQADTEARTRSLAAEVEPEVVIVAVVLVAAPLVASVSTLSNPLGAGALISTILLTKAATEALVVIVIVLIPDGMD